MNHNKFWFLLFWVYYVVNAMRNHQTSKLVPILRDTMIAKLTLSDLCHTAVYSIDCTYGNWSWRGEKIAPSSLLISHWGRSNLIFDLRNRRCQTALRTCYLPETFYLSPLGPSGCDSGLFWQARFLLGSGEAVGSSPHHPWTHIFCGYILYTAICLNFNALNLCKLPI